MKYLLGFLVLLCASCVSVKQPTPPPTVSTAQVIDSLNSTKEALEDAGEQNTNVAKKIDKALSLAEKLDALLEQIEKDYNKENKNVLIPIL